MEKRRALFGKQPALTKPLCIGVIGGMGPMAGVELQRLIVVMTPAKRDAEHIPVICVTDPAIPDRTKSLLHDGGKQYVFAIQKIARALEAMGTNIIAIPCNTAHARLKIIQEAVSIPIADMISLTCAAIKARCGKTAKVGLLATDGTLVENVYEKTASALGASFLWKLPAKKNQKKIMEIIYAVKTGQARNVAENIKTQIRLLKNNGAEVVVLGCTELSLYFETVNDIFPQEIEIIDPLRILAKQLVFLCKKPANFTRKIQPPKTEPAFLKTKGRRE